MANLIDKNIFNSLDFLPEGYFIVDNEFRVLYWNKSLEMLTGVLRDEIINQKLFTIFPNFGQVAYQKRIEPVFSGGPPVIFSGKLHKNLFSRSIDDDGYFFRITISTLPLSGGKYNALFSIENRSEIYSQIDELVSIKQKALQEISERERIHKKLINQHKEIEEAFAALSVKNDEIDNQRQRLLELNATKDKFFSILAHDLINPFNAMIGLTDLMSMKLNVKGDKEINLYFEILSQTIRQTYSLLENLLEWSRAQTGKIQYVPKTIALRQLVLDTLDLHKLKFNDKSLEVNVDVDNSILVTADSNMLSTIFRNLLSNAIKFTQPNGRISISTAISSEGANQAGNYITIAISDTGVGISPDNLNKLFRIDQNFTTLGTNNEKGTGLGLMLCKEFVEINGGQIWVKSEAGKGTTFFFTLPKA